MSRIFHWGAVGFDLRNNEEIHKYESGCGMIIDKNKYHHAEQCVSAIAQVGGDPAIVGEMLAKLKECEVLIGDWGSHTAEAFGSSKQLDADIKAIRFLIAKAERKV